MYLSKNICFCLKHKNTLTDGTIYVVSNIGLYYFTNSSGTSSNDRNQIFSFFFFFVTKNRNRTGTISLFLGTKIPFSLC